MNLMIVESPNKVEKISSILGDGWKVAASAGHIRDLVGNDQGVEPPEFVMQYGVIEGKQNIVSKLKTLAGQSSEIYLATDPDKEGEAISWHLKEVLKLKSYKRVTFDAINEEVIKKAFGTARLISDNAVRSQEARRAVDRLVGWMVSKAVCRAAGMLGLSAGRVQSVAVRLVAERERDIQKFKVTNHFGAQVSFGEWTADWNTKPFLKGDEEYMMDQALAAQAAAARAFKVLRSETVSAKKAPPAPFRSATLMQAASNKLKFSPEKTMSLAQSLFAAGHISYHRTDKQNFDESSIADIRSYAAAQGMPLSEKVRKWKSVEGAQEGHEAIRPMHLEEKVVGTSDDERAIYRLIWTRAIASQLADAEYKVNDVELEAQSAEGHVFVFKARGRVLVSPGWKALMPKDDSDEEAEDDSVSPNGAVPALVVGHDARAESGRVLEKKTKPPGRYSEASLIAKMESLGIGRPSTYATVMKNIKEREYIVEESKDRKLRPTQRGMVLVVALVKAQCGFVEYSYTASLEKQLDRIAAGETTYKEVVASAYRQIAADCEKLIAAEVIQYPCPKCKRALIRMPSGKKEGAYFWGCSAYRETGCDGAMADVDGKPGVKPAPALSKFACPNCGKPLINRVEKGKYDFFACSGFPKCKSSFNNENGKPVFDKKK